MVAGYGRGNTLSVRLIYNNYNKMKRLLIILLVVLSVNAHSQQSPAQVQAKRGVFTERLFLKDRWIDRLSTDLNTDDSTRDNVIPTGKAIADFMRPKAGGYIKNQFSAAQPANLFIQGKAVMGLQNNYSSALYSGLPASLYVTQNNTAHGLVIQRSSNDKEPAGLVFFKNKGTGFNTLNAVQPGDTLGSISYSGIAGNNTSAVNVMSMHGLVEKTGADYVSSGFVFNTTDTSGSFGQRVWLNADGNLLLGNATTNPYRLNVENGQVRINSLAGSGDVLVGANVNGKLVKITLNEYLFIRNDSLHAIVPNSFAPYNKYYVMLNQQGQGDPAGFSYENTFGEIRWTRNSTGNYTGTLMDHTLSNKVVLHAEPSDISGNVFFTQLYTTGPNTVTLITKDASMNNVDGWTSLSIEIRSYTGN